MSPRASLGWLGPPVSFTGPAPLRIYVVKTVLEYLTKGLPGRVTVTSPGSVSRCHRDINKEVRSFLQHTVRWFVRVLEPGPTTPRSVST